MTPSWLANKIYLVSRSAISMGPNDQILAGFPKTGTTWVRYFLYSLLQQRVNVKGGSIDAMNRAMPEFAHDSLFRDWAFTECNRIIKTHWRSNRLFRGKKAVLIIRDPRDVAVSYYHYATASKSIPFEGTIGDVIRSRAMGIESFMKHYRSWENDVDLIVKYEDLKSNPEEHFALISDCFGIRREPYEIDMAVTESRLDSMKVAQDRSEELKKEFSGEFKFVRKGGASQWNGLFTTDDIDLYQSLIEKYNFPYYE